VKILGLVDSRQTRAAPRRSEACRVAVLPAVLPADPRLTRLPPVGHRDACAAGPAAMAWTSRPSTS